MNQRVRACIERLSAIAPGAVLNFAAISANAPNRLYVNDSSCKCATTADFTGGRRGSCYWQCPLHWRFSRHSDHLTMISSTTSRSAYVYVTLSKDNTRDGWASCDVCENERDAYRRQRQLPRRTV